MKSQIQKPKLRENADVIRVWYCEQCGHYQFDFDADKLTCRCGYHMTKRRYGELK